MAAVLKMRVTQAQKVLEKASGSESAAKLSSVHAKACGELIERNRDDMSDADLADLSAQLQEVPRRIAFPNVTLWGHMVVVVWTISMMQPWPCSHG